MFEVGFVVLSCSKFQDLWPNFFSLQQRFWPEISRDLFICSDCGTRSYDLPSGVTLIDYGVDRSWSENLQYILNTRDLGKYDYLFFMMEDGYFTERVDHQRILNIFSHFHNQGGNFLTLLDEPQSSTVVNEFFGEISEKSPYRATVTSALWKPDLLKSLLVKGESAWLFEKRGARRTDGIGKFYSCRRNELRLLHMVVKGKLLRESVKELEHLGETLDSNRPVTTIKEALKMRLYGIIRKVIFLITPPSLRRFLVRGA